MKCVWEHRYIFGKWEHSEGKANNRLPHSFLQGKFISPNLHRHRRQICNWKQQLCMRKIKIKRLQKPNITCFLRFSSFFWISFSRFCSAVVSLDSSSLMTTDLEDSWTSTDALASAILTF